MPAGPGRSTRCVTELRFDREAITGLNLLPIETRESPKRMAELREDLSQWRVISFDADNPDSVARALAALSETKRISLAEAVAWGKGQGGTPYLMMRGRDCRARRRLNPTRSPKATLRRSVTSVDVADNAGGYPNRGRKLPEIPGSGLRELVVDSYRIVYRRMLNTIEVLTVFEGHRLLRRDELPEDM